MTTDLAAAFTTSSPDTRPAWCDSVGTWRVAHADRLEAALRSTDSAPADVYATHYTDSPSGHRRLWVGCRDNMDTTAHSARVVALGDLLRAGGLSVRAGKMHDRVAHLIVTDKG